MADIKRDSRVAVIREWYEETHNYCENHNCDSGCRFFNPTKRCPVVDEDLELMLQLVYPRRQTYKELFLEQHPNAQLDCDGYPVACLASIYGDSPATCDIPCHYCWDKEVKFPK